MLFADAAETTWAVVILGFATLFLTICQTLWQDWRAKRAAADVKTHVAEAATEVKKTAESAATTAEAVAKKAVVTDRKLDNVYEALNGNGLMGAVRQLGVKLDTHSKSLAEHIKDDSNWQAKLDKKFDGLEELIKGSPIPPAGGELVVELHGTATTSKGPT